MNHRIRAGTYAASVMTSTYAVENFAVVTDQAAAGIQWLEPVYPSGAWKEFDAVAKGWSSSVGIGRWNGSWYLALLTPGMVQAIRAQIFPTDGFTEDVTLVTWTYHSGWLALNAVAQWNEPAEVAETKEVLPGLLNMRIDFIEGVVIAYGTGGDFNADFSSDFSRGGIPT